MNQVRETASVTLGGVAEFVIRQTIGRRGGGIVRRFIGGIGPSAPLVRCKSKHGLTFSLDPASVMDVEMMRGGYYEPEVLGALLDHLPEDGVFWDVGANIGVHSITVRSMRPGARVISFEPVPLVASRFIQNAELNGVVPELMPVALGPHAGYAPMSVKLRGNSGISSLKPWPGATYDANILVRLESGDSIIAGGTVPAPNVLKIDVEGYEYEVLMGLADHLGNSNLKAIVFESAPELLERTQRLLQRYGLVAVLLQSARPATARNYLALRQDQLSLPDEQDTQAMTD
jgi:FkbM family methyltransferase